MVGASVLWWLRRRNARTAFQAPHETGDQTLFFTNLTPAQLEQIREFAAKVAPWNTNYGNCFPNKT